MEAAGDGERSSFRGLHAARYVLAAVMTVLVATITFNTVKLVLHERSHDPVQLSVVRGAVLFARRAGAVARSAGGGGGLQPALVFYHSVRVSSARGFKYYATNSTACLFASADGSTLWSPDPQPEADERDAIVCFSPGRTIKAVEQRGQSYFLMEAKGTRDTMNSSYFNALYNKGGDGGSSLHYVTLRLEGAFVAERRSGWNTTSRNIYYCKFLIISGLDGDEVELLDHTYDTPCQEEQPSS